MKMLFLGRKKHAAYALEWALKQKIDVVGVVADSIDPNSPVRQIIEEYALTEYSIEDAYTLVGENPDFTELVVSYLYSKRIREPLLSAPKLGSINFHPAILPDWKGTAGYNIAILNKLSEWGASAHYMDESIDTGSIIKVSKFKFNHKLETAYTLEKKTQETQLELFKDIITEVLIDGKLKKTKQKHSEGTYITRKQMEDMKRIDPDKDDIDNKIRAFWFPPYTGAYIEIKGKKYTVVNEQILKNISEGLDNDE